MRDYAVVVEGAAHVALVVSIIKFGSEQQEKNREKDKGQGLRRWE